MTTPTDATVLADTDVTRAMVVMAHPDDVDFSSAGTIAAWTRAGHAVTYVICTDGQAGGFDLDLPRADLPRIRRKEQEEAARVVGVDDVRFLGLRDGELRVTTDFVRSLVRLIREVRPDRMLIPSPERDWPRVYVSHPDHLAAGEAAMQAVYPAARNPFAFPELADEGLEPWTVREVWLTGHPTPNHAVDVTDTFEPKVTAILAHVSQHPDPTGLEPRIREWLGATARQAGLPADRLAEPFAVFPTG